MEEVLDRLRKLVEDAKPETVVVVGKKLFEAVKGLLEGLKSQGVVKQY